ncbi:PqiC family protein [Vibrio nitrifigilis]|uniref:Membrane integrity-associated transporter subunit PqiC n=1 Tax=Vibrio nitrifigilis TaxID=2789781 RepID=A0ABS0GEK5_9VIBR|nr:PqiC family protein [Vibrio nitrifigilis]MBF9000847.1 membrane integrity-associated transporter subunit PqiC [Vibrio nitrifigilis]
MFSKKTLVTLACCVSVWGCSSAVPTANEYLMMGPSVKSFSTTYNATTVIPKVEIPLYLVGTGMVLVSDSGEVTRARQHLWAEPLDSQLQRITLARLQQRLPSANWLTPFDSQSNIQPHLLISVERFDASPSGHTLMEGHWLLRNAQGKLLECGRFKHREPLNKEGYSAMAQSLTTSWLNEVVDPIAQAVSSTPSHGALQDADCQ